MSEQIKVSELVEVSSVDENDYVMIIQNQANKKAKVSKIKSNISEAMQAILAEKGTYSTEEKRVGTWIDGKPTYRKVVTYTLREVHSTGTMGIPHSIQNLKAIINLSTSSSTTDGAGFLFPCGTYQGGNTSVSSYDNQNLYFEIYNDVWSDGRTITIIIEYTKTTD